MYGLSLLLSIIVNPDLNIDVQQFNSIPLILTQEQVVQYGLIKKANNKETTHMSINLAYTPEFIKHHNFFYEKHKNQWELKGYS